MVRWVVLDVLEGVLKYFGGVSVAVAKVCEHFWLMPGVLQVAVVVVEPLVVELFVVEYIVEVVVLVDIVVAAAELLDVAVLRVEL